MATHLDDEEQFERLKAWWKDNWIALVGGLVIGFGGIGGWEAYQQWRDGKAEAASQMYEDLRRSLELGKTGEASNVGEALMAGHAGSPYAAAGALLLAQRAVQDDRLDEAAQRLQWAADNAKDAPMAGIARLRYARVLLARGEHDAALKALDGVAEAYAGMREELRGDILLAKGDSAAARTAFEKALGLTDPSAANRIPLRQKYEDLAVAGSAS